LRIANVVLFSPAPSRRGEERAALAASVGVTLTNARHPANRARRRRTLVKALETRWRRTSSLGAPEPSAAAAEAGASPKPSSAAAKSAGVDCPPTPRRTSAMLSDFVRRRSWSATTEAAVEGETPSRPSWGRSRSSSVSPPQAAAEEAHAEARAAAGERRLTISVDIQDVTINIVSYDSRFAETNLKRIIAVLASEEEEDDDDDDGDDDDDEEEEDHGEGAVGFSKAIINDAHVNLYVAALPSTGRKTTQSPKSAAAHDFAIEVNRISSRAASGSQPANPALKKGAREFVYRPLFALTLTATVIGPKVFQRRRRLALWLERIIVKALASTVLDGVGTVVDVSTEAVSLLLRSTLGTVDRIAARVGGPGADAVFAATGLSGAAGAGVLGGAALAVGGVTAGAKTLAEGVANLSKGDASGLGRAVIESTTEVATGALAGAARRRRR